MCTALQKHLWLLCWRAANKQPISRSILSLQTLHIFSCAEEYFPAAICLLLLSEYAISFQYGLHLYNYAFLSVPLFPQALQMVLPCDLAF